MSCLMCLKGREFKILCIQNFPKNLHRLNNIYILIFKVICIYLKNNFYVATKFYMYVYINNTLCMYLNPHVMSCTNFAKFEKEVGDIVGACWMIYRNRCKHRSAGGGRTALCTLHADRRLGSSAVAQICTLRIMMERPQPVVYTWSARYDIIVYTIMFRGKQ